jgi:hypothetical protein
VESEKYIIFFYEEWLRSMVEKNGWGAWLRRMVEKNGWEEWLRSVVKEHGEMKGISTNHCVNPKSPYLLTTWQL